MALTKEININEFLVRFALDGAFQGAHVVYRTRVLEDGAEISNSMGDPQPVALDDTAKIAEVSAAINTAALADLALKTAALAEAQAQVSALAQQLEVARASAPPDTAV